MVSLLVVSFSSNDGVKRSSFLLFQASIGKYHLVTLMIVQKHVVMRKFGMISFLLDTDKIMDICGDVIQDES